MFNFLKKTAETHSFSSAVNLLSLKLGDTFSYNDTLWTVKGSSTYDWGNDSFSKELSISSRRKSLFLSFEDPPTLDVFLFCPINFKKLGSELHQHYKRTGSFPHQIRYKNQSYLFDAESEGHYKVDDTDTWEPLISFDYCTADKRNFLSIEQWGDDDFEASTGTSIQLKELRHYR